MEKEKDREADLAQWHSIQDQLHALQGIVEMFIGARGTQCKEKISET